MMNLIADPVSVSLVERPVTVVVPVPSPFPAFVRKTRGNKAPETHLGRCLPIDLQVVGSPLPLHAKVMHAT